MAARLLCAGQDMALLETRCYVLEVGGYFARPAVLPEAKTLLRTGQFDLVIVSARLEEEVIEQIRAVASTTPVLVLTEFTLPGELLDKVARALRPMSASQAD